MNELAVILNLLVLILWKCCGTKWNFCIPPWISGWALHGVDPYYLSHKAEMLGYHPELILAGRRINNGISNYTLQQTIKKMIANGTSIMDAKVIVLGLTFKENCSDLRNSKVADLVKDLQDFGAKIAYS